MLKIIFKTTYVKSSEKVNRSGYLEYISKREGVEKNKILIDDKMLNNNQQREEYISYIGQRPNVVKDGKHGLFGMAENVDLEKAKEALKNYKGNMWVHIISLTREDAERLGYVNIDSWKKAITTNIFQMSSDMNINPNNLVWYAAFHNQLEHPHVHLVMYSKEPKEGYVNKRAIDTMRSRMANTIFKDDLITIFKNQTSLRDELKNTIKEKLNNITNNLELNDFDNNNINKKMKSLSEKLKEYKGKKIYGYLPKSYKNLVNDIYYDLSKNKKIIELFELWYQEKENILLTYRDTLPLRCEIIDIKDFKSIKNIIIRTADNMNYLDNRETVINDNSSLSKDITSDNKTIIEDGTISIDVDKYFKNCNYIINEKSIKTLQVNPSVKLGYHLSNIIQNVINENLNVNKVDKKQIKELLKQKVLLGHSLKDYIESEIK